MSEKAIKIIAFFKFIEMGGPSELAVLKEKLVQLLDETGVRGTIIIASEGFNSTLCGEPQAIDHIIPRLEGLLGASLDPKVSFHELPPFRKIDVQIRPEIVTLRRSVDIGLGEGTHVSPTDWNTVISDPETVILDARNDYEFRVGTFEGAINPQIERFSELPDFVARELDPAQHKRVAMFCTGGIRCEKFAPYLRSLGFETVYQLDGGILRYLETVPEEESLWRGECFVFDERISVDHSLNKGSAADLSGRHPEKDS